MNNRLNRRGLQTLRTHTTRRALPTQKKHELYLKLTTLEMEKARRVIERESLAKRIAILDARLVEVATEQMELLARLSADAAAKPPSAMVLAEKPGAFPIQY